MNVPRAVRILLFLALPLAVCSSGSAASLSGKVTEVVDGGSFAMVSLNHPLKVKLIGVAAPDQSQSYAGLSRQHLSDLVLDKFVTVRFSALDGGFLVAQVQAGEMDVNAQMIRDGGAWYNQADERLLNEAERQVYAKSQDAARGERRGLWQDESPVSPWEFRKAQIAAAQLAASSQLRPVSLPRPSAPARRGTEAGLASEDLMGGMVHPGSIAGKPEIKQLSPGSAPGSWLKFQPADRRFSVLAPSDGLEITYPVLGGKGEIEDIHYVIGSDGRNLYFMMWVNGPNQNSSDASAAADVMKAMLTGINHNLARNGGREATATPGRMLKVADYGGRQFALNAGSLTGAVRILSKQIGEEREVLLLCVLNGPGNENTGDEFLTSLKIVPSVGAKRETAQRKQSAADIQP